MYSSSGTENPQLLTTYPSIEGTYYPYPAQGQGEVAFRAKYRELFGQEAAPSAAYAYDSVMLVAEALKAGNTDSESIATFLHEIEVYQGIANTITFDKQGRVQEKPHIMKQVKNGQFSPLTT